MNQKTIEHPFSIDGIGLHTGEKVSITVNPAPSNTGIIFIRQDIPEKPAIKADINSLLDVEKYPRRSSISNGNVHIHTIEHLMSAIYGLGIDNLIVEIRGGECPGLDGSAQIFVQNFLKAGLVEQNETKNYYKVKEPIYISENSSHIVALPSDTLKISYTLDYPNSLIKSQYASFEITPETYANEIAPARTFCLEEEVERLKMIGLGKGSDFNNTVVIGENGVIKNKFRFPNEPVRHKICDLIGDLALLGMPLKAHIIGIRSGHAINTKLVRTLKNLLHREKISAVYSDTALENKKPVLEMEDIEKIIPHRFPFLLVDRIIELEEDKRVIGVKNVSVNEWFFQGHFPGRPVMPGVLIVEAIAQVAGVLMLSKKENQGKLAFFMSIEQAKFRRAVRPGDQLILKVEVSRLKSKVGQVHGKAYVGDKIACEATLMFALVDS
ncbi:MAG: bifunctional UDP-3-O-[3-hydroxymyristoyl] N-acetylglucosamine deacetylase/3-hydroxyacyl-ACP dehydratase [Candidatus Omnitrophica bacterium]|nr:bifunctional UDP-3-O-[3-hydroxymyristoyl] N-acetylglucosamine deacetylase/3-hydroxyacyl-ACP dehydratase [Candidatus Omnitrophota bacterium]